MTEPDESTPRTQLTQPKGRDKDEKLYELVEIPVPKVSTIRAAIRKIAKPDGDGKREQRP